MFLLEIPMGPLLEHVQVPLDGIPSFRCANGTTQLGAVCKFAETAFNPIVNPIINEHNK